MKEQGCIDLARLATLVSEDQIDTVVAVFPDLYGRLLGKRFDAGFFLESVATHGTHCCDYLLTVDMEMTPVAGYELASWQLGYGDFHMVADISTLRVASWLDSTVLVICDLEDERVHAEVAESPRSILRRQVAAAGAAGFTAAGASELEYYIFEDSYRQAFDKGYDGLQSAGWYIEDYHMLQGTRVEKLNQRVRRELTRSGIPVESSKGEWGLGQHELNIRYAEVLDMADRHVIYKQCLKEVAEQLEMSVTFMAKYDEEQAGSSCHLHLSLWKDGVNAFAGDGELGPLRCSDTFRWFLGGWIAHVSEMMVCYAPTVNSYKRYRPGSWAPTRLAWSQDNRTAGFRVVGRGDSLRIECRLPGADCNPYLAYAAALASGLDGIACKTEPPPHFAGDMYTAEGLPVVASSLEEATAAFEQSTFAQDVFGEAVVRHYAHFFRTEVQAAQTNTANWDRKRYFERI